MTVPATPRRAGPFAGTGAPMAYPFGFKLFSEADVRVVVLDVPTNVETDATLGVDYTVTLNPDQESTPGGTVNCTLAATKKVTLIGDVSIEQPTDLPDGGAYRAQQVENALDRLTILMQQLKEIIDRCAKVPVSSTDAEALFASINVLAANLATLQTVVANIADLVALAGSVAQVNALAALTSEISALSAVVSDIAALGPAASDITTVAGNMGAILAAPGAAASAIGAANAAAASYDAFDDRYLGAFSAAPTLDNDGNALLTGALYWDTLSQLMRIYTGSLWLDIAGPTSTTIYKGALSGTQVSHQGIPYWASQIEVDFSQLSTNSTGVPFIILGTTAGVAGQTGIGSVGVVAGGGSSAAQNTGGLGGVWLNTGWAAATTVSGRVTFKRMRDQGGSQLWVSTLAIGQNAAAAQVGGSDALIPGVVDRVFIDATGGSFDGGVWSVRLSR